jgi:hypothetical protein
MADTMTLGSLMLPPQADSTRVDIETMSTRNLEGMGWKRNFQIDGNTGSDKCKPKARDLFDGTNVFLEDDKTSPRIKYG